MIKSLSQLFMLCHREREIFIVAYFCSNCNCKKILKDGLLSRIFQFSQFSLILSSYQLPDPTIQTLVFDIFLRINLQHCRAKLNEKRPKRSSLLIVNDLKFFFLCKKLTAAMWVEGSQSKAILKIYFYCWLWDLIKQALIDRQSLLSQIIKFNNKR